MVITGNIRSNGKQLAEYLTAKGENERTWILEVDGRENADQDYLNETILSMELMAEMTKSDKAFFHAEISPDIAASRAMTDEQWKQAADILSHQLGYTGQRRVITMHEKKGRIHAHVVFERYNYATGRLVNNKNSRLKMDNARKVMEQVFDHKRTPHRNPNKSALKEVVSKLWNDTKNGKDFIKAVRKAGYMVAEGVPKRPFRIVDKEGRSFDLVRQLEGVRTKEVRERLRNETLIPEKRAIELMREEGSTSGKSEQQQQEAKPTHKPEAERKASLFADNRDEALAPDQAAAQQQKNQAAFVAFQDEAQSVTEQPQQAQPEAGQRKRQAAEAFATNKASGIDEQATIEQRKQELIAEQKRIQQRARVHKRSR